MITKAQIQFVRSLEVKSARDESGCFLVEGDKLVREALLLPKHGPLRVQSIFGVGDWLDSNSVRTATSDADLTPVTGRELERLSLQKNPNQVLAVISRDQKYLPRFDFAADLLIGLYQVQDPGNVGTIIRLADWFGLGGVIATADSADFYSPKVVQASMGSVFRVKLFTSDLPSFVETLPKDCPIFGTHQDGESVYASEVSSNGLILFGNESHGLSPDLLAKTTKNIKIPEFSSASPKPQSLNVSIAAAIICSEFRRRGKV